MRTDAAWNRCIPRDDPTGGDVSHRDLLSIRADDVLEHAVRVEKGVPVVIADNHTVVADAFELCIAVNHLPVVQRSKAAIAIDESVINSAAVPGIHIDADNHAVIVERSRNGRDGAGKVRHGKKGRVAAELKDVLSVGITISTEESVKVIYPCKCCAVVRCVGMDDQGCGRSVQVRGVRDSQCIHVAAYGVPENVSIAEPTVLCVRRPPVGDVAV